VQEPPWDPDKARINEAKHGVTFHDARIAANHPLAREWPDPRHSGSEQRVIIIGPGPRGILLFVVAAKDEAARMRLISARRATKRERHAYEDI
jgi:uncharacterized DUF497 family protein